MAFDGFAAWGEGPVQFCPDGLKSVIGFAGGGGSSVAFFMATGRTPDACYNHWSIAVHAHRRHFPRAEHHTSGAHELSPDEVLSGETIAFGWFSPDCTDFSKAKGGAPRSERIRGLAWTIIPWAVRRKIRVVMLENVTEFLQWGPVYRCPDDWRANGVPGQVGEPIAALRGVTMALYRRRWAQMGYWLEFRELNAADFGAPTTRKRLYGVAVWVGVERVTRIALGLEPSPVVWPARTHAPRKDASALGLKAWRGACEVIDWSLECPSIYLTAEECAAHFKRTGQRVRRPKGSEDLVRVVSATDRRIARGYDRYMASAAEPFVVSTLNRSWGGDRAHGVREPAKTLTASKGGDYALLNAHVAALASVAHGDPDRAWSADDPLRTQTEKNDKALTVAHLVGLAHGEHVERPGARSRAADDPISTIHAGGGNHAVVTGALVPRYGERDGQAPRALDVTGPTPGVVPTGNGGSLMAASLHQMNNVGGEPGEPARAQTGHAHAAVQAATLIRQFGSAVGGRDVEEPLNATMGQGGRGGGKDQIVAAHLDVYYGAPNETGADPGDPARTSTGKDRMSLVAAWLEQANTGMVGHEARAPLSTIVAGGGDENGWGGATQRLVEARLEMDGGPVGRRDKVLQWLWSHFGMPTAEEWADPTRTLSARRKFGLLILDGVTWMVVDIGLRMLTPKELAAAMGLPPEFDLSVDFAGDPIRKTHQTQMIGNMVSPPPAAALIAANCPDLILPGWTPGVGFEDSERRAA